MAKAARPTTRRAACCRAEMCSHIGAFKAVWSVATKAKSLASSSFQPSGIGITLIGRGASKRFMIKMMENRGDAMRLVDNLRKAEEKGVMRIRRGVERTREEWADVERRIRQRMRIYPHKQKAAAVAVERVNLDQDAPEYSSDEPRKPIISIRGQDMN